MTTQLTAIRTLRNGFVRDEMKHAKIGFTVSNIVSIELDGTENIIKYIKVSPLLVSVERIRKNNHT